MNQEETNKKRKEFTRKYLQTPEIYMRRWSNNEIPDTLENNIKAMEAMSLEIMCNGSGADILCKAREHTEHCIDIKDSTMWDFIING